ncbi:MAG: hypothetical protein J6Z43_02370 [Clostridiales bacterium]|nr:hypothetical protein [Clostridiales bacterium]
MSGTYRNFAYDGTYDGFLCVAVKCINLRVFPDRVLAAHDGGEDICYVRTDYDIAGKMHRFLGERSCAQVQQMVVDGFLTDMDDRERALIDLIARAVRFGACVADDYEHANLRRIHKAILDLYREEQTCFTALATEDYKEAKTAVIDPHNRVLPLMKNDLIRKTEYANLFIYDRRHSMVLFKKDEADDVVDVSRMHLPEERDVRVMYDLLWQYLSDGTHLKGIRAKRSADLDRLWYIAG